MPLGANILERRRTDDRIAQHEDISLRVAEWTETIVVLLSSGIPKSKVHGLSIDDHVGIVVVKHGGDVFLRESVCGERDQELFQRC